MNDFAVFGNPIKHSKSPQIHALFSFETGIKHSYNSIMVSKENFEETLQDFFRAGGSGANITTPFKERAFYICNQLTNSALQARAVNTIKKLKDGLLLGDNTDGIGLVYDLQSINFLNKHSRILLIGAGGAARGVLFPILSLGCQVVLTNRTFSRAIQLWKFFNRVGNIKTVPLEKIVTSEFDLIINATTAGIHGETPSLPKSLITSKICCYDMFYQDSDTPFISWCRKQGGEKCIDGLGMLVTQAAYSFLLWHNVLPPILPVIKQLRCK